MNGVQILRNLIAHKIHFDSEMREKNAQEVFGVEFKSFSPKLA